MVKSNAARVRTYPTTGYVIYEGPSRIDGKPIVCIATVKTKNEKTGPMIQTWILRADQSPLVAINSGADESICGACPLRGVIQDGRNRMRGCYVTVRNAPRQIWEAWQRGRYPKYDRRQHSHLFRGRLLRLGAYGDPVAVPLSAWRPFLRMASGRTGYTHSWRLGRFRHWKRYVMASTHTTEDNATARAAGWRSFRARAPGEDLAANEVPCPASDEAGKRRTCATCLACNGGSTGKRSVSIVVHGSRATLSLALHVLDA